MNEYQSMMDAFIDQCIKHADDEAFRIEIGGVRRRPRSKSYAMAFLREVTRMKHELDGVSGTKITFVSADEVAGGEVFGEGKVIGRFEEMDTYQPEKTPRKNRKQRRAEAALNRDK
jgi:hypothetical protein